LFLCSKEQPANLFIQSRNDLYPTQSELAGEYLSPTQPHATIPKPFVRQLITENDLNKYLPDSSYEDVKKRFAGYKKSSMFEPLSKQGTIVVPGFDGGAEWGGPSYDPTTGILYVNANEMVNLIHIVDLKTALREMKLI
jgi:quinoprotein glucose dehydrogenase